MNFLAKKIIIEKSRTSEAHSNESESKFLYGHEKIVLIFFNPLYGCGSTVRVKFSKMINLIYLYHT